MFGPARVTRYTVTSRRGNPLPKTRLVALSDLHACMPWMGKGRIAGLVEQTNTLGADIVLLLGDYVGHVFGWRDLRPTEVAELLAGFSAPLGAHAVFGNHDWSDDMEARRTRKGPTKWHRAFAEAGITVLSNDMLRIDTPQGVLALAGLESQRAFHSRTSGELSGADDLPALLSQLDPDMPTVLMAHEPDIFPDLPDWIDLTLSGHTHGGQVAPFGYPILVPSIHGRRFAYGHHVDGTKQLVVSGGLGMSGLPIRIGRPAELVLVDLA
ncbi:MAG: metallophosphoesterase [Pseudomonadota bacterium]